MNLDCRNISYTGTQYPLYSAYSLPRARIFKRLWNPGIDTKEWIPPAYTEKGADIMCY